MAPADLVHVGVARGAYGVRGWIRIERYAVGSKTLQSVRRWWLLQETTSQELVVEDVKCRGDLMLAKWQGCDSKEAADSLSGAVVAVARGDLPMLAEGEHYLADIIGFRAINREGIELGAVSGLREGDLQAQWLEITDEAADHSKSKALLLIPLNDRYIDEIEMDNKVVKVDWQRGW